MQQHGVNKASTQMLSCGALEDCLSVTITHSNAGNGFTVMFDQSMNLSFTGWEEGWTRPARLTLHRSTAPIAILTLSCCAGMVRPRAERSTGS